MHNFGFRRLLFPKATVQVLGRKIIPKDYSKATVIGKHRIYLSVFLCHARTRGGPRDSIRTWLPLSISSKLCHGLLICFPHLLHLGTRQKFPLLPEGTQNGRGEV